MIWHHATTVDLDNRVIIMCYSVYLCLSVCYCVCMCPFFYLTNCMQCPALPIYECDYYYAGADQPWESAINSVYPPSGCKSAIVNTKQKHELIFLSFLLINLVFNVKWYKVYSICVCLVNRTDYYVPIKNRSV